MRDETTHDGGDGEACAGSCPLAPVGCARCASCAASPASSLHLQRPLRQAKSELSLVNGREIAVALRVYAAAPLGPGH